jgi:hypothetical protein
VLNVVYYTSGATGSGRVVTGVSIGNAFRRNGIPCQFTIVSGSDFSHLASDFSHVAIPLEESVALSAENYASSALFNCLKRINPDILIVDLLWFPLYHFIDKLNCVKIFLSRQVSDVFFSISLPEKTIRFIPDVYEAVIATEPFESVVRMRQINPIVIRNHNEILTREDALKKLGVDGVKPVGLFAYNGEPGEYEAIKKKYSYLEGAEYQMIYSNNYSMKGFFPIVDYYNAIDFIISGAGYNSFWETIYFGKDAVYEPVERRFESQKKRIMQCSSYLFTDNGADQLVGILMGMM